MPLVVAFAISMAAAMAVGRRGVLVPSLLGVGFTVLLAVNGAGDTDLLF